VTRNSCAAAFGALLFAIVAVPVWATEPESVLTFFRVIAGRPEAASGVQESVLVVPGTVVMPGLSAEEDASNVLDLMKRLKDTYRLGELTITNALIQPMRVGVATDVPSLAGDLTIRAALLGFNQDVATYGVAIAEGGKVVAEPRISVRRGERAITASLDGAAAPYVFLVIEPIRYPPSAVDGGGPAVMPKLIQRVQPVYPAEARKAGFDGIVILQGVVGADGALHDLKPFRAEAMGLTQAALDAVSQWRYEPARDAAGRAVEAKLTITISFILEHPAATAAKS